MSAHSGSPAAPRVRHGLPRFSIVVAVVDNEAHAEGALEVDVHMPTDRGWEAWAVQAGGAAGEWMTEALASAMALVAVAAVGLPCGGD